MAEVDRKAGTPDLTIQIGGEPKAGQLGIPPISEPFQAPELLVDGISNVALSGANVKLTMFSERSTLREAGTERVVVARLVLPIVTAQALALTLRRILDDLVVRGAIPPLPNVDVI